MGDGSEIGGGAEEARASSVSELGDEAAGDAGEAAPAGGVHDGWGCPAVVGEGEGVAGAAAGGGTVGDDDFLPRRRAMKRWVAVMLVAGLLGPLFPVLAGADVWVDGTRHEARVVMDEDDRWFLTAWARVLAPAALAVWSYNSGWNSREGRARYFCRTQTLLLGGFAVFRFGQAYQEAVEKDGR